MLHVYSKYAFSPLWDITHSFVICHVLTRTQHQSWPLRHNTSANFRSSCFDKRYKHRTQEPLFIYDSYLYRMSLLSCPCDIRKKVIVSSLIRASCNNCCARQFVKCRQQVFLMAHPLLCIRSSAAGAIDFFLTDAQSSRRPDDNDVGNSANTMSIYSCFL
jgi:hypothetical protein